MIFFLLLIFELKSSTVTSRSSNWNLQIYYFLVLKQQKQGHLTEQSVIVDLSGKN